MSVAHYWSVIWSNPYTDPPDEWTHIIAVARIITERGNATRCPDDIEGAMRTANRAVSGREYGGGYAVAWHVDRPDAPRRISDEARYRIRRTRMERRMRARYPLFADELIDEEHRRRPEYFGLHPQEASDGHQ